MKVQNLECPSCLEKIVNKETDATKCVICKVDICDYCWIETEEGHICHYCSNTPE